MMVIEELLLFFPSVAQMVERWFEEPGESDRYRPEGQNCLHCRQFEI